VYEDTKDVTVYRITDKKRKEKKQRPTKHIYKTKGQVTLKTDVNSGAPEGSVDHDPLVALVVLI
jgi:hypothetical protein